MRRDTISPIFYRWELTPKELYSFFRPDNKDYSVGLTSIPFKGPKLPFEGTPYVYQYGVSDTSVATDIVPLRKKFPDLPLTGDKRSGIILYDKHLIIGCYLIPGQYFKGMHQITVHEKYRRRGLASRMIEQWFRDTPGVKTTAPQSMNTWSVRTFFKAHTNVTQWALREGKDVPERVQKAVKEGLEMKDILRHLELIEGLALKS